MTRASIRKRLREATPGPWWLEPDRDGDSTQMLFVSCIHDDKHGEYGDPIADLWNRENRPLIAHAPADIAALLAVADAAAEDIDACRACADGQKWVAWGPDRGWCAVHVQSGSALAELEATP